MRPHGVTLLGTTSKSSTSRELRKRAGGMHKEFGIRFIFWFLVALALPVCVGTIVTASTAETCSDGTCGSD
jgi:hypothetical protein